MDEIFRLAELGFRIIPVGEDKRPIIKRWPEKATTDIERIKNWKASFNNDRWGVVTGKESSVFVVDVDAKNDGLQKWADLIKDKELPLTATCRTGGGGLHLYFKYPDFHVPNSSITVGIDVRGERGQAVVPPSMHESGNQYAWEVAPWDTPPAEAPKWLLKLLKDPTKKKAQNFPVVGGKLTKGMRNDEMYKSSLNLARLGSPAEFVISTMKLWRDEKQQSDIPDEEIKSTVQSAFAAAEKSKEKHESMILRADYDNSVALLEKYKDMVRYANGRGWFVWNGHAWREDERDAEMIGLAVQVMTGLRDEALEEAKTPTYYDSAIKLANWANISLMENRTRAMVNGASFSKDVLINTDGLDPIETNSLLNVANGIVDLKTGMLFQHDKEWLITKEIETEFDPKAECPFWEHTLELAFDGDQTLISYMKRALGYSLTGDTSEQCFFICWGEDGNNGKSTILETMQSLMGPYAQMSDILVITTPIMDNRVASSLARLPGARLVSMNEANEGQRLSEALVKQMTGGDTLQACHKYKAPFEFKPQFKLWIRTNDKPILRGTGNAMARRIKLIPFEHPIPADKRLSRTEVDRNLKDEFPGILRWCIEGAIEWYKFGLMDPEKVKLATLGYMTESDTVLQFFDECVEEGPNKKITKADLYRGYKAWSYENGARWPMTSEMFSKRVSKKTRTMNIREVRSSGGKRTWEGIDLAPEARNAMWAGN